MSRPGAARRTAAASRSRSSTVSWPVRGPGEEEPDPQRPQRRARGERGRETLAARARARMPRETWTTATSERGSRSPGQSRLTAWTASGARSCAMPALARKRLDAPSRTVIEDRVRSRAVSRSRRAAGSQRMPESPAELTIVSAPGVEVGDVRRLDAHAADGAAEDPRARQRVGAVEPVDRLGGGREPVGAAQVDRADLAADGPDDVPRLVAQQRAVGVHAAVEQRAHVGGERGGGDDLRLGDVALGDEQEQQVAEVVALVRADEQDPRRAAAAAERGERGDGRRRARADGHGPHST